MFKGMEGEESREKRNSYLFILILDVLKIKWERNRYLQTSNLFRAGLIREFKYNILFWKL